MVAHCPIVLVLEDEPLVQMTLCTTLRLLGFAPQHARTVEDALRILAAMHVDAVILDVRLPDPMQMQQTGLTLLTYLRATTEYATIPALIFTGMPLSREDEELAHRQSAQVFYKPERYTVLIERLGQALGFPVAPTLGPLHRSQRSQGV